MKSEILFNLDGLEDFVKKASEYRARVGVLGDKTVRDDGTLSNADIGAIQMFGSITNNIPPRDFLMMPIQRNEKNIMKSLTTDSVSKAILNADFKRVFKLLGATAEQFVQQAFETSGFGQWAPNKPSTIARKGSSKPLIDTAQLRRSITSDVIKKDGEKVAA